MNPDKEWSFDDCVRQHDVAHQLREFREEEQLRYRETQLREDRVEAEVRRPKLEASSSPEEREAYIRRSKESDTGVMGVVLVLLVFAFIAFLNRFM
jgi:hypothetical protein